MFIVFFPVSLSFFLRSVSCFCFRTQVHPHGKVERKERPILSALYYERYIKLQPTLLQRLGKKGGPLRGMAFVERPRWRNPWVGAWDGLGFTRRLDHLLSLLVRPCYLLSYAGLLLAGVVDGGGGAFTWLGGGGVGTSLSFCLRCYFERELLQHLVFYFWDYPCSVVFLGLLAMSAQPPSLELCKWSWISSLAQAGPLLCLRTYCSRGRLSWFSDLGVTAFKLRRKPDSHPQQSHPTTCPARPFWPLESSSLELGLAEQTIRASI